MTQRDVFLLFYHTSRRDTNCVSRDDRVDDENLKNLPPPPLDPLLKFLHLPVARGNVSKFFTSYPEKWRSVIKSFIAQNRVKIEPALLSSSHPFRLFPPSTWAQQAEIYLFAR